MTGNVVKLELLQGDGLSVEPNAVLSGALDKLTTVVVIGVDARGELYCAMSEGRPEAITLIERAKAKLIASWLD